MSNLSDLLPAGAGGKQVDFVASGTLSSGQTVALKTDGTVSPIAITAEVVGTETEFNSARSDFTQAVYDVNANKIVVFYYPNTGGKYGVVGTVSGSSISFGTPVLIASGAMYSTFGAVYDANAQKVVYGYREGTSSGLKVAVGTVSGTSISFGTPVAIDSGNNEDGGSMAYDANAQKIVFTFPSANNSQYGAAIVGTVSGTSMTFGTKVIYTSEAISTSAGTGIAYDSVAQKVLIGYSTNSSPRGYGIVGTVSGTSISFGTTVKFSGSISPTGNKPVYSSLSGKIIIVYEDSATNNGLAVAATLSGTSVSYGDPITWVSNGVNFGAVNTFSLAEDTNAGLIVCGFANPSANGQVVNFTVTGSTITASTISTWDSGTQNFYIGGAYHSVEKKTIFSWMQGYTTGEAITYSPALTNSANFIGITDAAISNTASGSVTVKGGVASNTGIAASPANSVGSSVVFDDGGPTTFISSALDPDNNKIVHVFCTTTVYAIVGTVSGTAITYGSAVQINTDASTRTSVAYDTANNKFVIAYEGGSYYGYAVVGTVSGTSISFGTPVVFYSGNVGRISVAYDVNAGKTLIMHTTGDSSTDRPTGIVGTVSGTSISFGSPTEASSNRFFQLATAYDANAQKTVVAGQDYSGSVGTAFVATISGTSVSFGSSTNFLASAVTSNSISIVYNGTDNNVVIGYSKGSDNKGYLITGTVSGTSISFAGETEFSGAATTNFTSLAYKASGNILGLVYNLSGSTKVKCNTAVISGTSFSFGTEQELSAAATDTTAIVLDEASDNFVVSYGDGSNNSDGTANVLSVSTSLVPNSTYYVQDDGTLSTTTSSVLAGKALSSTSINLDYTT